MVKIYKEVTAQLAAKNVQLVAVSKTKPNAQIIKMYELGQRHFGENRVQELVDKQDQLPKDILWHQIGHLQRNKVKYIAPFVHLIHAVDSLKLLQIIDKEAEKNSRTIDCLLQFKIAEEESKFGLSKEDGLTLLQSNEFKKLKHIRIVGVMGMASFVEDEKQVRQEFQTLKAIFDTLKSILFSDKSYFKEISMGMSGDYQLAVEEGSTMVRIGSLLFGNRYD